MESGRSSISGFAKNSKTSGGANVTGMLYAEASEEFKTEDKKAETSRHIGDSMASLVEDQFEIMTERAHKTMPRDGISTGIVEGTATAGAAIRIPKSTPKPFEQQSENDKDTLKPPDSIAPNTQFYSSPVSRRPSGS